MDDGVVAGEEAGSENSAEQPEDDSQDENKKSEVKREHESEYTKLIYNNYDCIRVVQEALNDAGYSCGFPDGMIGEGTRKAIRDFQRDHGLEETGKVNDELIDVLGCWDKADLCFYFRATSDREGRNPTSHFGKSDQCIIGLHLRIEDEQGIWPSILRLKALKDLYIILILPYHMMMEILRSDIAFGLIIRVIRQHLQ